MADRAREKKHDAQMQCNLCAICWMPLQVGNGGGAETTKWKSVQVLFKGKPAFALVVRGGEKINVYQRPVMVFGHHDIAKGRRESEFDHCHFVHFCCTVDIHLSNLWILVNPRTDRPLPALYNSPGYIINSAAEVKFFSRVRMSKSLFRLLCTNDKYNELLTSVEIDENSNWVEVNRFAENINTGTKKFAGCSDCNGRMTITKDIHLLFEETFQKGAFDREKDANDPPLNVFENEPQKKTDNELHYLILGGLLEQPISRERNGRWVFEIQDEGRRKSWTFRCVIMWCALNILFCMRHIKQTNQAIGHHVFYIYEGLLDFHISLWLYFLYLMHASQGAIPFALFHFYYASCFPLYLLKTGHANAEMSLQKLVVTSNMYTQCQNIIDIDQAMNAIYTNVFHIWSDLGFKELCVAINRNFTHANDQPFVTFFTKTNVASANNQRHLSVNLDIDSFVQDMGAFAYWFHFKFITIPRIGTLCKQYDDGVLNRLTSSRNIAQRVWRQWFRLFDTYTRALGSQQPQKGAGWLRAVILQRKISPY